MIAGALFAVAGGMVGLAFAAVPLYQLFCQVTGYGGTPRIGASEKPVAAGDQTITVRFDANVNSTLPWKFRPAQNEMTVRLGETVLAHFVARNVSAEPIVGTATFNVTPFKAGPYFAKVECFCFTEQSLDPGQEVVMPVSFYVDPEIHADPGTREIRTITLSYTFFRAVRDRRGKGTGTAGTDEILLSTDKGSTRLAIAVSSVGNGQVRIEENAWLPR